MASDMLQPEQEFQIDLRIIDRIDQEWVDAVGVDDDDDCREALWQLLRYVYAMGYNDRHLEKHRDIGSLYRDTGTVPDVRRISGPRIA